MCALVTGVQTCALPILQPSFIPGFALSADYYDIKINGAIGTVAAQTIVDRCAEGVQAFCEAVVRGPNDFGNNLQVFESTFNFAVQRATGIDFEIGRETCRERVCQYV